MILSDKEAVARLSSPTNLMNKLASTSPRKGAMGLFGINRSAPAPQASAPQTTQPVAAQITPVELVCEADIPPFKPSFVPVQQRTPFVPQALQTLQDARNEEPKMDDLLSNGDAQIQLAHAHDTALKLLTSSITKMTSEVDNIHPSKLPSVISAASKVVESIRRERNEASKDGKDREVHYHFYTPVQKKVEQYQVIEVQ